MESTRRSDEDARINALHELGILDTPAEERFDRITKATQIIFNVPIALVSLVDANRQWFKSCIGLTARETPRSISFCSHAILNEDVMTVSDTTKDERFLDNPLVTGEPNIRFYAGKPIKDLDGNILGTLCIIDSKPREFSTTDKSVLTGLANWVESEFNNTVLTNSLKKTATDLSLTQKELLIKNEYLAHKVEVKTYELLKKERMAAIGSLASRIAHDLNNPLSIIQMSSDLLKMDLEKQMDEKMKNQFITLQNATLQISQIITDVLNFAKTSDLNLETTSVSAILKKSISNIIIPQTISFSLPENNVQIKCDSKKMESVFSNLITNAIQAMDNVGSITMELVDSPEKIIITFVDSGPGIPDNILHNVFESLFSTKSEGTGLGLGICKSIIEKHRGTISVKNNPTTFTIELPKS